MDNHNKVEDNINIKIDYNIKEDDINKNGFNINKDKENLVTNDELLSSSPKKNPKKKENPKTKKGKIIRRLKKLFIIIFLILLIYIAFTICCTIYENNKIKSYNYGVNLNVNGHKMVANIKGENNNSTIVFLTGIGTPSPVLFYKPITEVLSNNNYKVITIDPFGYGLSDIIEDERTVDKVVSELHNAVGQLGLQKYYIMAHSMGGVYSLYWSNKYPEEVLGFIGLDVVVPRVKEYIKNDKTERYFKYGNILNFLGFSRVWALFSKRKNLSITLYDKYNYTDEEIDMFKNLSINKAFNSLLINEAHLTDTNLETIRDMKFPQKVPVLQFLAEKRVKKFENNGYVTTHTDVGSQSISNEIITLPGDHGYFAMDNKEEIVKKIASWTTV